MIKRLKSLSERLDRRLYEDYMRDAAWQALLESNLDPSPLEEQMPKDPVAKQLMVSTGGLAVFATKLGTAPDRFMRSLLPYPKLHSYRRGDAVYKDVASQYVIRSGDVRDFLDGTKPLLDTSHSEVVWDLSVEASHEVCVTEGEEEQYADHFRYGYLFLTGVLQQIGRLKRPMRMRAEAVEFRRFMNEPYESDRWALSRLAKKGHENQPLVSDLALGWGAAVCSASVDQRDPVRIDSVLQEPPLSFEQEELICAGIGLAHAHADYVLRSGAEGRRLTLGRYS